MKLLLRQSSLQVKELMLVRLLLVNCSSLHLIVRLLRRKYILTLQLIITQEVQQIVQVLLNIMVVGKHCQELGFSMVVVILNLEYLHFMD